MYIYTCMYICTYVYKYIIHIYIYISLVGIYICMYIYICAHSLTTEGPRKKGLLCEWSKQSSNTINNDERKEAKKGSGPGRMSNDKYKLKNVPTRPVSEVQLDTVHEKREKVGTEADIDFIPRQKPLKKQGNKTLISNSLVSLLRGGPV